MIYNMRVYDLKMGTVPKYMDAVRDIAVPIRADHGVKLAGWYYTDIGHQHRVVHIWAYQDYAHFEQASTAVKTDSRWKNDYIPAVKDFIVKQEDWMMRSPDFAPQVS
jgi:hypothetical protein